MKCPKAVVGVFEYMDDTIKAIEKVKGDQLEHRVFAPFANHELEDAVNPGKSPIRFVTAIGALTGITFGFALPILCSLDWPLRVSAKDVVSVPGFVVIGYECTILFGALATLTAMIHFCRLPDILRKVGYHPRFSDDRFGVVVGCSGEQVDKVSELLKSSGAETVEVRDAL